MAFDIDDFNSEFNEEREKELRGQANWFLVELPQMEELITRLEKYIAKDHFQEDQRPHDSAELLKQRRDLFREQLLELNRLLEKSDLMRQAVEHEPGDHRMHDLMVDRRLRKLKKQLCDQAEKLELSPPYEEDDYLSDHEKRLRAQLKEHEERMKAIKSRFKSRFGKTSDDQTES